MMVRALLGLLALLISVPAVAHEVRPAYLELTQRGDGKLDVLWKQPSAGLLSVAIHPESTASRTATLTMAPRAPCVPSVWAVAAVLLSSVSITAFLVTTRLYCELTAPPVMRAK